jgi:large subunit ribosomal protein L10e
MGRKPASMYRAIKQQAFTRRTYIGGVPGSKIAQFEMGNKARDFPLTLSLVADEACQIRHNALEAARVAANRFMEKRCGKLNYFLKIRAYPHMVLRENKQATGAGADRISKGMSQSFGKSVGSAARLYPNQSIISISTTPANISFGKEALRLASAKLPSPTHIIKKE